MKKVVRYSYLLIITSLLFPLLLSGQNAPSLIVTSYNDSWGGGFTKIQDNLRTYGFGLSYENSKDIRVDGGFSYLTNRFDIDTTQRKGYDEFYVNVSFPVYRFKNDDGIFLTSGIFFSGKLFGETIQTVTHDVFGVSSVAIPYYNFSQTNIHLGYSVKKTLVKTSIENATYALRLSHHFDLISNYLYTAKAGISQRLNFSHSHIDVSTNYIYNYTIPDNVLQNKVYSTTSGLVIGYRISSGPFTYFFETYPLNDFSTGGVAINFFPRKDSDSLTNKSFEFEVSLLNEGYGYNFKYSRKLYEVFDRSGKIILNHNFHSLLSSYLPDSPEVNGHANQLTIGTEINLLNTRTIPRFINPYINLSAGYKKYNIYSSTVQISDYHTIFFVLNNDLGIVFKVPVPFGSKDKHLNLSFFHRLIIQYGSFESADFKAKESLFEKWQSRFGGGLVFPL